MEEILSRHSSAKSSIKSRFINDDDDFKYRLKSLRTFQRRKVPVRPSTTPEKYSPRQLSRDAVDRIASVQSPRLEFIHQSLGDGIMMLREEKMVSPSKFVNLDKITKIELKKLRQSSKIETKQCLTNSQGLPSTTKIKPAIKKAIANRYASIGIQTDDPPTEALRRPSTVSEVVTSYAEEAHRETSENRYKRSSSAIESSSLSEHRCTRCSHLPDIQIEGRSLNYFLSTANGPMASTHCEILGASTCPDCTRTKSQINYETLCNSTVEPNENDVYKLQVIQKKVPFMGPKEVKRRVYDGQILDAININVLHLDIDSPRLDSIEEVKQPTVQLSKSSIPQSRSFYKNKSFPAIPEVSTSMENPQSVGSHESISESSDDDILTAKVKIQRHESSDYYERMNVEFSEKGVEIDNGTEVFQDGPFIEIDGDQDIDSEQQNAPSSPTAQISSLTSDYGSEQNRRSSGYVPGYNRMKQSVSFSDPKVSIFKRGRPINKYITPSSTFFYNIADLYGRLYKRTGTYTRSDSINLTLAAAHMQLDESLTTKKNDEQTEDDSGSDASISPRIIQSLLSFEPPIMYEKKSRYIGIPSPDVGNLSQYVSQESISTT